MDDPKRIVGRAIYHLNTSMESLYPDSADCMAVHILYACEQWLTAEAMLAEARAGNLKRFKGR